MKHKAPKEKELMKHPVMPPEKKEKAEMKMHDMKKMKAKKK